MASDWLSQFGDLGPFFHVNVVALLLPPSPRIPCIIHPRPHHGMRFGGLYCPPVIPAELWWISEVGWPYEISRRARAELGRTEASPEG